MKKICIDLQGSPILGMLPQQGDFASVHDEFDASNRYDQALNFDDISVVTLVSEGKIIGFCSYFFHAFNLNENERIMTTTIDSVFIIESERKKSLSKILARYVACELLEFESSDEPCGCHLTHESTSNIVSQGGGRFVGDVYRIFSALKTIKV
ncbi:MULTISPECIES: hypothetical protein [Klebsiella pneumoniae complex]|uniref:hypothetical protein n=1 Tax=Klebsiella pneumoniae complex TaxID=3390273 RepID=UPI000E2DEAF3|nr:MULTISPECIES: hypothetical protein [Klebsiella]THQ71438.1 hypothetical protein FAT38_18290 [Klebsiella pneumoniae subsp. pneumoniae]SVW84178.1 Uncharacterised protein [Klebsiella pneumoniae]HBR5935494.1 hypothetical protein [Klebsiella pneumoniae]HBW1701636.1 hypothetical protein [Klebsiella pneumoniae]HBW1885162.1 hypothetical protein [Klebsiella pneumoniae]